MVIDICGFYIGVYWGLMWLSFCLVWIVLVLSLVFLCVGILDGNRIFFLIVMSWIGMLGFFVIIMVCI